MRGREIGQVFERRGLAAGEAVSWGCRLCLHLARTAPAPHPRLAARPSAPRPLARHVLLSRWT